MSKPKLVLMTVGASFVEPLMRAEERLAEEVRKSDMKLVADGKAPWQRDIEQSRLTAIERLDMDGRNGLQQAGPEIKSMAKLGLAREDRVVLYASDSPESVCTARIVAEYARRKWQCAVEVQTIDGLQVDNPGRFRSLGIQNYVQKTVQEINNPANRYGRDVILNATAGYKGVVPYTTLIGLLFQVPVKYIFERSDELLTLPPLPVDFDQEFVRLVEPRLARIEAETAVSGEQALRGLNPEQRDKLLPLLEFDNGQCTLSALGLIVYERYRTPPALKASARLPKDKDQTQDWSQEPHRSTEFERFKDRLASERYVDSFRYLKGESARREVRLVGELFHVACHGIELEVITTACHASHYSIVQQELAQLLGRER
ncbi:MAG: putative CRISPR-associated protein [Chloroflexi bacterium]|nr:putative CRISPR-associated protein [Chloroflexota bacterium]